VEEGNQQGDEGNERNREAHMLTLFCCLVLLWACGFLQKTRREERERQRGSHAHSLVSSAGVPLTVLASAVLLGLSAASVSDNGLLRSGSSPVSSGSVGYAMLGLGIAQVL